MIPQPASSPPRRTARRIPRILRRATGLTITAAAVLAGGPAALAGPRPAPDGGGPIKAPPVAAAAYLPAWAVAALVAATVALSVATTLITLSVERMRQARTPTAAETQAVDGDILASHNYRATHDSYRAGTR